MFGEVPTLGLRCYMAGGVVDEVDLGTPENGLLVVLLLLVMDLNIGQGSVTVPLLPLPLLVHIYLLQA